VRVLALVLVLLAAACASTAGTVGTPTTAAGTPTAATSPSPTAAGDAMFVALCEAAAAPEPADAEAAFERAHEDLHALARELEDADQRPAAATLLEAKQRVEAAFAEDPPPADLSDQLTALVDAAAEATVAAGRPRPACPEGSS
jgi:hypothetical protein